MLENVLSGLLTELKNEIADELNTKLGRRIDSVKTELKSEINDLKMKVELHGLLLTQYRPFSSSDYSPWEFPESQWNSITNPDYR